MATEGIHGFVADAAAFNPSRAPDFVQRFTPQQWASIQAIIRDPDGRHVSLEAQGSAPESHG